MQVNGKEYKFRERVVMGQLLKVESLQRALAAALTVQIQPKWWHRFIPQAIVKNEERTLNAASKSWMNLCEIMFENADSGLDYLKLTPEEVTEIPVNFFAIMEAKQKKLKETSSNSQGNETL